MSFSYHADGVLPVTCVVPAYSSCIVLFSRVMSEECNFVNQRRSDGLYGHQISVFGLSTILAKCSSNFVRRAVLVEIDIIYAGKI